jgi:DNA-binding FrmR family transcriptional regulator
MATMPGHKDNLVALRRVEGQIRGVQKMIQERKYCIDILNQIQAVKGALARIEDSILKKHLESCVAEAIKGACEKEKQQKMDEVLKLIHRVRGQ